MKNGTPNTRSTVFLCKNSLYVSIFCLHCALSAQLKHTGVKLVVLAVLCDKVVVTAALDDTTVFQHHYCVAVAYRAKAVGNYKHRAPLHQCVHALFD